MGLPFLVNETRIDPQTGYRSIGGDSFGHDEAGVQTAGYVYRFGMHSFKSCKAGNGGMKESVWIFQKVH